ncbi:MAG: hypothetical protein NC548_27835 [Lachnospiraceae bacterium]|nr:hypothetical protein [Lachnospiraceae bacterium]
MDDTIYFHLPGFFQHQKLNYLFATFLRDDPDSFYPNIKIGSVYDTFPNAIWNGGRVIINTEVPKPFIEQTYSMFNDLGIPVRHTFTNNSLEPTDVYDRYCNAIMKLGDNGMNEVLVNQPELEEYIREKYPSYKIISSTTKRLTNLGDLNRDLEKDYKLVVLDYTLNRDPRVFTLSDISRIEILVDAYCCDNCPRRTEHYKHMSGVQANYAYQGNPNLDEDPFLCQYIADDFYRVLMTRKSVIKVEELYGFYHQAGICNFKIEGRTNNPADVLESYIYYMVKPEFRDHTRLLLLRELFTQDQQPQINLTKEEFEELSKKRAAKIEQLQK